MGPVDTQHDGVTIRYEYEDAYDRYERFREIPDESFRSLLEPWPWSDVSAYTKVAVVVGRVMVLRRESILKCYKAVAALSTPTKHGLTMTEMRRLGLLEVRNNIERQMYQDREYFRGLEK
jgi:hypothetical protein